MRLTAIYKIQIFPVSPFLNYLKMLNEFEHRFHFYISIQRNDSKLNWIYTKCQLHAKHQIGIKVNKIWSFFQSRGGSHVNN